MPRFCRSRAMRFASLYSRSASSGRSGAGKTLEARLPSVGVAGDEDVQVRAAVVLNRVRGERIDLDAHRARAAERTRLDVRVGATVEMQRPPIGVQHDQQLARAAMEVVAAHTAAAQSLGVMLAGCADRCDADAHIIAALPISRCARQNSTRRGM